MQREVLKHIKGNDLRVYADLITYADKSGKCFPSVETIAKDIGIKARNVQKSLANLEKNGWIARNYRTNTSTMYQVYWADTSQLPVKTAISRSIVASKSDVSPLSKSDRSGVSENDASGVSKSYVLTDQLTDHKNIQQEQVVSVVGNDDLQVEEKFVLSIEEKDKFETLWKTNKQDKESKASAISAWTRYCSYEDPNLIKYITNSLDKTSGTYMTSQMKQASETYIAEKERKEKKAELRAKGELMEL